MSWMDSWSRPSKSQAVPPPLYLTQPETKYCHTCGRTISPRKNHKTESTTPAKYCSSRCRSSKPGVLDRRIESAFVALLEGSKKFEDKDIGEEILEAVKERGKGKGRGKGEHRIIIPCSAAEALIFGSRSDETKVFGRKKNRASRALGGVEKEWRSVDMESDDEEEALRNSDGELIRFTTSGFAGKVRPPQEKTDINASVGGEKGWAERTEETSEAAEKRREGQRVADEKEMVKRAARRGCVFGFDGANNAEQGKKGKMESSEDGKRVCEAVMNGVVVEPSFAKGDWGIRWRE
ncbi:hypothetical protein E2P81_ATG08646 [Venturia nashicola]|uniref:Uncharacterized protein n=1 Tax=Venturia nashicola TaxID=86259 RepID=A0A4Z1P0R8_9PEZI|nr:hypothetical protein E6O75_ATG08836 [Venturia nashicola]TLD20982.1 hypothetical protein E2P81_ATG08646 [Venturia nashicola]